jgi:serine/threonine protein kinase
MSDLQVQKVHGQSRHFARFHHAPLPRRGTVLARGKELAAGGFGTVYPLTGIGGKPLRRPLLAKLFHSSTLDEHGGPGELIARVVGLQDRLDRSQVRDWPDALLALPYWIASCEHDGRDELVAMMLDLGHLGYEEIGFESQEAERHRALPWYERVELACSYAQRAALLESLSYVHADQNPENLLFNTQTLDTQIIDFDAGVVVEKGDERPLTPGKPDDCMPPEIKRPGLNVDPIDIESYTPGAERWSVGSIVGLILFGIHPGFFLRFLSAKTIAGYAGQGPCWPQIDLGSREFRSEIEASYFSFLPLFEAAPGGTREAFARFFAAGTNGDLRPSAREWVDALELARKPPRLEELTLGPDVALEGSELEVSWQFDGADRVECPELGTLEPSGSATLTAHRSTRLSFEAFNRYGRTSERTRMVRVVPLPRIERIPVPAFPSFDLRARIPRPLATPPPQPMPPPRFGRAAGVPRNAPLVLDAATVPRAAPLPLPFLSPLIDSLLPKSIRGDRDR